MNYNYNYNNAAIALSASTHPAFQYDDEDEDMLSFDGNDDNNNNSNMNGGAGGTSVSEVADDDDDDGEYQFDSYNNDNNNSNNNSNQQQAQPPQPTALSATRATNAKRKSDDEDYVVEDDDDYFDEDEEDAAQLIAAAISNRARRSHIELEEAFDDDYKDTDYVANDDDEEEEYEIGDDDFIVKDESDGDYAPTPRKRGRPRKTVVYDDEDFSAAPKTPSIRGRGRGRPRGSGRGRPRGAASAGRGRKAKQDDEDSDDEFKKIGWRLGARKRNQLQQRQQDADADLEEDTRTRRKERKSYKESDEEDEGSDAGSDFEHAKPVANAGAVEEIEENIIDVVLDNRTAQRVIDGETVEIEEFLIKWKGWAHIHNTWQTQDELRGFKGYKKVENYIKRLRTFEAWKKIAQPEEIEQEDIRKQLEKQMQEQWVKPERVIASRRPTEPDADGLDYLVKWQGLPYSECTWEDTKPKETAPDFDLTPHIKAFEALCAKGGYSYTNASRLRNVHNWKKLEKQPDYMSGGELRDYQLEGINWLVYSWFTKTNSILADEMGLGKTVQSISFLNYLAHEQGVQGPFLVVVPLSTLQSWEREFKLWAPEFYVVSYTGDKESRQTIRNYEFYFMHGRTATFKFNVLLTTYENLMKDSHELSQIKWSMLVVDEAHRLKSDSSKLFEILIRFYTEGRLLITGTPLQNSIKELWCLLHFLMPEKFNSLEQFESTYSDLGQEEKITKLHKELAPHILRRLKKEVEKSLPSKIERILRVEMTPMQKQYYKWIITKNIDELRKGTGGKQSSLVNIVMQLKKCCNHPFLFEGAEDSSPEKSKLQKIIRGSGKMILLDKLLVRLKETGHRVLIFSQMVRMLDILGEYMRYRGFGYQRLDGSTSSLHRQHAMDHFNAPDSPDFCFLLSTRAGGLGINLTTADTVIIFDSDWNPQNDLQAEARAHRIGQKNVVNIYRLITKASVEEKILERAKQKMILDHLVIQKMDTTGRTLLSDSKKQNFSQFTKEELEEVLKFGAADLFSNDNENAENGKQQEGEQQGPKKTEDMDIDEILARAEKHDVTDAGEGGSSLLSAFKVANFTAIIDEDEDADDKKKKRKGRAKKEETIDPFWDNLVKTKPSEETKEYLPPRQRKRITTYEEDEYEPPGKVKRGAATPSRRGRGSTESDDSSSATSKRARGTTDIPASSRSSRSRSKAVADEGKMSAKDARLFVRSFKKFADLDKINEILSDANLSDHIEHEDGFDAACDLVEMCQAAVEARNSYNPNEDDDKRTSSNKTVTVQFNGVPVNADEILQRVEEIKALKKKIEEFDSPEDFRVPNAKAVRQWPCQWGPVEDTLLLRGILKHGIGNWDAICQDESLKLSDKICPKDNTETYTKVKPAQLQSRVDALLKNIVEEAEERAKEAAKRNQRHAKEEPLFEQEIWDKCKTYFVQIAKTIKDFRDIARDEDMPKTEKLAKIKQYLTTIGKTIDNVKTTNPDGFDEEVLEKNLWFYIHKTAHTTGNSDTLQKLYHKLVTSAPTPTKVTATVSASTPSSSSSSHGAAGTSSSASASASASASSASSSSSSAATAATPKIVRTYVKRTREDEDEDDYQDDEDEEADDDSDEDYGSRKKSSRSNGRASATPKRGATDSPRKRSRSTR